MKRLLLACSFLALSLVPAAAGGLTEEQLTTIRSVSTVLVSPDAGRVAYTLTVPRSPGEDDDGPAWTELRVRETDGDGDRLYVDGKVGVGGVRFLPDGSGLTYLAKRGDDEQRSLWMIPIDGGESRRLVAFATSIEDYRVSPDGSTIAFLAQEPESEEREKAKKKGYDQEVFEEDWRPRRVWTAPFPAADAAPGKNADDAEPAALDLEGSAFRLEWAPDGTRLAVTLAERPLIDDGYMKQRIHVVRVKDAAVLARLDNRGKLGEFCWSPDGKYIAMISAADANDPAAGRLLLARTEGGPLRDLMPDLEGHVHAIAWKDANTVTFLADVGTETHFGEVSVGSESRTLHFRSGGSSNHPLPLSLSLSADGNAVAFGAERPSHPSEVFFLRRGDSAPRRLTNHNPWLDDVELAKQETIRIEARDGLEFEGILLYPLDGRRRPAPLILVVHGGPESHVLNGWVTSYSRPGQLAAAQGYAVLYPNYRGSTGRGVAFSKLGQGDAAGAEFDDLVDAVEHLVSRGVADRDRVGITGGSYGGYATAWCATRYTDVFRAGVMFVGISNKVSKGLTTDIPVEDVMVHTRFDPWTKWQFSLERSPVYYAEQSRTALLIAHGQDDTRVHPAQSLQLYRALKLIGKTPVRYVRYPGEGHGNRRAASRDDYTRRMMRWFDTYLRQDDPQMPPWDLPPRFLEEEKTEGDAEEDAAS